MALSPIRAAQIESSISDSETLEDRLEEWQAGTALTAAAIRAGQTDYVKWYTTAQELIAESDRSRFREMYEGTILRPRIRAFLTDPLAPSPLYDAGNPTPLISRWKNPFDRALRESLVIQREILTQALYTTSGVATVLDELGAYFRRLPDFLSVLNNSGNPRVAPPTIEHEDDLQVVVHALLRMLYDDVRAEDPVAQHAGGSSRVDFLLRESGVVIETKMTRASLSQKKLGEELLIDWGRYPRHPDCRGIFAVIYDPDRRLTTPASLEHDLSQGLDGLPTRAIVVR